LQFRKGAQDVETFPEDLIVRVIAVLGTCSVRERAAEGGNVSSENVHLDDDFMKSVARGSKGSTKNRLSLGH
jgi:hypothetical protein